MSVIPRDLARTRTRDATIRIQARLGQSVDAEELSLALATSRQQLEALMLQNDELLGFCSLLTERFIQASALANRHRQSLALLFFDMNDFKSVNDKLGHDAGDKLLLQVATRLSSSIRKTDTACRYGGDEFVVLLTEIDNRENAVTALRKIRAHLAPAYVIDHHSIRLTLSNGLAMYPEDAQRSTDLMQLSDRAMFNNKYGSRVQVGDAAKVKIWLHDAGKDRGFV